MLPSQLTARNRADSQQMLPISYCVLCALSRDTHEEKSLAESCYKTLVTPGIGIGYFPSGPGTTGGVASQA